MRYWILFLGLLAIGCTERPDNATFDLPPATDTAEPLPFFGNGYRAPGDQCRRIGENAYTNQFLDDSADFVGCPEDMQDLAAFVGDTGAVPVGRTQGTVLFSVPRR